MTAARQTMIGIAAFVATVLAILIDVGTAGVA